jgi:hypothetical protein
MVQDKVQSVQYSVASKLAGSLHIWDGQDVSIYGCIDILILVDGLYHFTFSVPITRG